MTQQTKQPQKWATSKHGRPKCPAHGVRLKAVSAHGPVAVARCPVDGCDYRRKLAREPIRD
jgi:hypothetical protein